MDDIILWYKTDTEPKVRNLPFAYNPFTDTINGVSKEQNEREVLESIKQLGRQIAEDREERIFNQFLTFSKESTEMEEYLKPIPNEVGSLLCKVDSCLKSCAEWKQVIQESANESREDGEPLLEQFLQDFYEVVENVEEKLNHSRATLYSGYSLLQDQIKHKPVNVSSPEKDPEFKRGGVLSTVLSAPLPPEEPIKPDVCSSKDGLYVEKFTKVITEEVN